MSLFNQFGWQISDNEDDDADASTETNIFSHSSNFLSVAKEQAEREKQRAEKAKAKEERRKERSGRKTSIKREGDGDGRGSSKKNRIDKEESKRLLAKATAGFIQIDSDEDTPCPEPKSPVRSSPRFRRTKDVYSPAKPKSRLEEITVDEDDIEIATIKSRPIVPAPPVEDEDSDPELAELKRKAREKRKQQQDPHRAASNIPSTSPGASAEQSGQYPTPPPPDPVVQLLVTSPIPDSIPLIVCRKISQNLEPVKPAWISKQGPDFPEYIAQNIFFTHCGKRLFDSTLVKRLGVVFDEYGRLHLEGDEYQEEGTVKIHLEAYTPHLFEQLQQAEKARAATAAAAAAAAETGPDDEADEAAGEEEPEKSFRITIKAKDRKDFKIKVFPDTPISKILKNARKNMGFDESQNVYLEFDGERLEPDDRVGDTEIEDLMILSLYLAN